MQECGPYLSLCVVISLNQPIGMFELPNCLSHGWITNLQHCDGAKIQLYARDEKGPILAISQSPGSSRTNPLFGGTRNMETHT